MIKYCFLVVLFFCFKNLQSQILFEPNIGISLSSIQDWNSENEINYRKLNNLQFTFGVTFQKQLSEKISFGIASQYLTKGSEIESEFFTNLALPTRIIKTELTYLDNSIYAQYEQKSFQIGLGGFVGIPLKAFSFVETIINNESIIAENTLPNSRNEIGVMLNIGITFNDFKFTLEFKQGLNDVDNFENTRTFNSVIIFKTGYNFRL